MADNFWPVSEAYSCGCAMADVRVLVVLSALQRRDVIADGVYRLSSNKGNPCPYRHAQPPLSWEQYSSALLD
jgi:hypothetical protein